MNQQGPPDLAQEAVFKLQRLVRTLEQESRSTRKVYREYGITETQGMILRHLAEHGPQALNGMSKYFFVTPSNMTGIIDRLEAKGLVERKRQSDRRIVHIHLSGKGHKLTGVLPNPLAIKLHAAFSRMSAREIEAFTIPIQKLLQTLSLAQ
ncbi:MAG: MarR family transcriptional regulator [Desulfohalobiaceae bacterium]|nr:MarR family transcriptional regulator [Desulfohalobiaceae bacterium]